VTPPRGPHWHFAYESQAIPGHGPNLQQITTPSGGYIRYEYNTYEIPSVEDPMETVPLSWLQSRASYDRDGAHLGTWTIVGGPATPQETYSARTTITTPSNTTVEYVHGMTSGDGRNVSGTIGLVQKNIYADGGGVLLEREDLAYTLFPSILFNSNTWWGTTEVTQRNLTRFVGAASHTYTTQYKFSPVNLGDYHHPYQILENNNQGLGRTTTFTYKSVSGSTPRFIGLPTRQDVAVGANTVRREWTYNGNGFRTSETAWFKVGGAAIKTTFAPDNWGNVTDAFTATNKRTTWAYTWGQWWDMRTPEYVVTRDINPNGTVHLIEQDGLLTTLQYDELFRQTSVQTGASLATITEYDDTAGAWIRTTRGTAVTTQNVDGFGRAVQTNHPDGTRTITRYDAEGRVTDHGYPVDANAAPGSDPLVHITYDALGRVTSEANPDGPSRTRIFGLDTVTSLDENNHATTQTLVAFGHPDDAWLAQLTDANQQTWSYGYDALGQLFRTTAPDGLARTWTYNLSNLLESETHPESGTTSYTYDAAGVLRTKTDANGLVSTYTVDGNDRVRSIAAGSRVTYIDYYPGTRQRMWTSSGGVESTFVYDGAGHLRRRQDLIDSRLFTTQYEYDERDDVRAIIYSSGRRVEYEYDAAHRVTHVSEPSVGRHYALGFTYHPSGGLATYMSGNLVPTTITYHPQRYWVTGITAGPMQFGYADRDPVGNVGTITDARSGRTQGFGYDPLDRLTGATSTGGYPYLAYAYDVHGNRLDANGSTYEYWPGTLRLKAQNGAQFTYYANGNLATATAASFTYTPTNLVETATVGSGAVTHTYDADDRRAKTADANGTTYFVRGVAGELLTEWHATAGADYPRDYIYAGTRLIAAVKPTVPTTVSDATIVPNGPAVTLTFGANQERRLTFQGVAGHRYSVWGEEVTGSCYFWPLSLLHPDGQTVLGTTSTCGDGLLEPQTAPVTGRYTIVVRSAASASGTARIRLYDVVDIEMSITPNGPYVTVPITMPGQKVRLSFQAVAGHRYAAWGQEITASCLFWPFSILKSDGQPLSTTSTCGSPFLNPLPAPDGGPYTVLVDPSFTSIGTVRVSLYDVVDITGPITPNGSPITVTLTPGQKLELSFQAISGHRYALWGEELTGDSCLFWPMSIVKSDGLPLSTTTTCGSPFLDPLPAPGNGVYTVLVDPNAESVGPVRVSLFDVVDQTGDIVPNGPSITTALTPGQKLLFSFQAIADHHYSLWGEELTDSCLFMPMSILKSDAQPLSTTSTCGSAFLEPQSAPGNGTYTVVVDPSGPSAGTARVSLFDVVDQTTEIVPNGTPVTATLIPGQKLLVTFQGIAGHRYVASGQEITNSCFFWPFRLLGADGLSVLAETTTCGSPTLPAVTVSANGTYTILVDPAGASAGDVRVTLSDTTGTAGLVFPAATPEYVGQLAAIGHSVRAGASGDLWTHSREGAGVASGQVAALRRRTFEWPPPLARAVVAFRAVAERAASSMQMEGGLR
jgi:YD repeat-containing protein